MQGYLVYKWRRWAAARGEQEYCVKMRECHIDILLLGEGVSYTAAGRGGVIYCCWERGCHILLGDGVSYTAAGRGVSYTAGRGGFIYCCWERGCHILLLGEGVLYWCGESYCRNRDAIVGIGCCEKLLYGRGCCSGMGFYSYSEMGCYGKRGCFRRSGAVWDLYARYVCSRAHLAYSARE